MAEFQIGDLVRVSGLFADASGNAVDPDNVFFTVKKPSGETTAYQFGVEANIQKVSAGNYYIDIDADASGAWYYRWNSTGVGQSAEEGQFIVERSRFF